MTAERAQKNAPDWTRLTFPCEIRTIYKNQTFTGILIGPNKVQTQESGNTVTVTLGTFVHIPRKSVTNNMPNAWDHVEYKSDDEWKSIDVIRTPLNTITAVIDQKKEKEKTIPKQKHKKTPNWSMLTFPCEIRVRYKEEVLTGSLIEPNKIQIQTDNKTSIITLNAFAVTLLKKAKEQGTIKNATANAWDLMEYKVGDDWKWLDTIRSTLDVPTIAQSCTKELPDKTQTEQKPKKYKKDAIPKNLRDLCWYSWIGNTVASAKCICCERIEIRMNSFECGHVIAESKGGTMSVYNLRPICAACNKSMGSENLADFKRRCGFGDLLLEPKPIVDSTPIKVPQPDNNTEPLSKRRKELPPQIQRRVWNEHIGKDVANAKCLCCKEENINYIAFSVGFVKDTHEGGTLLTDNLRPICSSCDSSIGNMSINEYTTTYFGWHI